MNARVEELLGPFDGRPGLPARPRRRLRLPQARARAGQAPPAAELGVDPGRAVMVGDIGADVEAAEAAGVSGILVPTAATRPERGRPRPRVARSLPEAVSLVLAGAW